MDLLYNIIFNILVNIFKTIIINLIIFNDWLLFENIDYITKICFFVFLFNIRIINFLLYGLKISLQLMETLIIVVDIAKYDRKWKCCHKTNMIWWNQMMYMSFKTHFMILSLMQIWPTRRKQSILFIA
jgi:hypothetical protein